MVVIYEMGTDMSKLSSEQRKGLKASDFCFPGSRRYPIPDELHARAALAMVAKYGSENEKRIVRACVKRRYPNIE